MKTSVVFISVSAEKSLVKLPKYIIVMFAAWVKLIEDHGYYEMRKITGYRDHCLKGKLHGKRSISLNRSYRVIYQIQDNEIVKVDVIGINNHDYKI